MNRQLWLEFAPISATAPPRLLVFLHGAGSSPEAFAPVAVAWQLKFPGAQVVILQAPHASRSGFGADWYDATATPDARRSLIRQSAESVGQRIQALQAHFGLEPARTILVGFSQGANLALELGRAASPVARIVVSYAGRLSRPITPGEQIGATMHLVHGEFDTWVPVIHAEQALRGLRAAGAQVTLDICADGLHSIGPDMVIIGTTRALQTVFRGRTRRSQRLAPSSLPTASGTAGRTLH